MVQWCPAVTVVQKHSTSERERIGPLNRFGDESGIDVENPGWRFGVIVKIRKEIAREENFVN
jgi:hypothetical protein